MDAHMPDHWGETTVAELTALADEYGTPFYLYDADAVNRRVKRVREALRHQVEVYYAVKANPNLELLRAIRDAANGLDVSSGGEVQQALLAGFDMAHVSFAGPAKTTAELATAIRNGVGSISVESMRELACCVEIAKVTGVTANVMLRINPSFNNRSFGLKMGGRPVQFGIDEEQIPGAMDAIKACAERVAFRGIHVYAGSQCFDVEGIVAGVSHTLGIVEGIEKSTSLRCRAINVGGGFGVAHGPEHRELDIEALGQALHPVLSSFRRSCTVERRFVVELGRYLAAPAGVYVCRVMSSKESRGKRFFLVDGGLHHHLAAAGTFGAAFRSNYALRNLSRPHGPQVTCTIAGPSCNPTDLLGIDVDLPCPRHGDLLAVLNAGSYGLTASPLLFLGRETPVELVRANGAIVVGRRRRSMAEFN